MAAPAFSVVDTAGKKSFLCSPKIVSTFAASHRGALSPEKFSGCQAEIIPILPDPDNAGEGRGC